MHIAMEFRVLLLFSVCSKSPIQCYKIVTRKYLNSMYIVVVEFRVKYRHTGQDEVRDWFLYNHYMPAMSEREILDDIGQHHITHLAISSDGLSSLHTIASKVTYLQLVDINSTTPLHRYLCLCEYMYMNTRYLLPVSTI